MRRSGERRGEAAAVDETTRCGRRDSARLGDSDEWARDARKGLLDEGETRGEDAERGEGRGSVGETVET